MPQTLLPIFPAESTQINDILSFDKRDGKVWYFHGCLPVFSHDEKDRRSFNMFTSQLVVLGQCKQVEIVRAFGVSSISVKRHVKKYREGGAAIFFEKQNGRKATILTEDILREAQEMLNKGNSRAEVSEDLCIKPDTLYRAILAGKLVELKKKGENKSERSIEGAQSTMGMGCTRMVERVLSSIGKLDEAPSIFKESLDVENAGVLWALPALLNNGLLDHTKEKFNLPQGFYGLIHIFLLLGYMALSRVKTTEQLRFESAGEWGLLLGLDRIPEVQTLRKKIKHLTESGEVEEWSSMVSQGWMESNPETTGTLYVDGHVRVYHGKQTKLPRRYVSRERLCLRGMTDYWVNDQEGRPFFVISTEFNSGLLDMLRSEIVPRLLKEVPNQPSDEELEKDRHLARFTLVFDREGYSPEFFKEMWEGNRIACLTYNKYPKEDWPIEEFHDNFEVLSSGETITTKIAERGTYIGSKSKGLWVREVRKLTETGHQTSVLSTDFKAAVSNIGLRMFARWSQENFFKYMMEHFNIDSLMDYRVDEVDETKKVVNPDYRKLESEIKSRAGKLGRLLRNFAEMSLSPIPSSEEVEEYEIKKGNLIEEIDFLKQELLKLKEKRKETSKHIYLSEMPEAERFSQLGSTRKHFIDTIKMIAYRAETAMLTIVREELVRTDDGRSLLRDIYTMAGDIIPNDKEQTLTIRLHHLTNKLSDKAALHLAKYLNETETIYPGTNMRMIYELVS